MAYFKRKSVSVMAALALLLTFVIPTPGQAGDPDKTIGGINPNLYVCMDSEGKVVDVDHDAVTGDGDSVVYDPEKTVDLNKLKDECKEKEDELNIDLRVDLAHQSRVEGFVVEFHPDPAAPGGWRGVFSRDVPVVISGPGFEAFKASDKDGSFFFDNLGAGPVTFNLRLPPDAHALNPNVTVVTNSFLNTTSGIYLGFYRGDMQPPDVTTITSPDGVPLAPANFTFEDLEGSDDTLNDLTGMPSVGGVLPRQISLVSVVLAVILVIVLPAAGLLKLRRKHNDN